jgi:inner membrane protein
VEGEQGGLMLLRTHLVFSVFIYFLIIRYFVIGSPLLFFIFLILATSFVDIDSRKSKIGKKWYFRPLQWFVRHRGMVHSLFFAILLSLIIAGVHQWAGIGFFVGYLSHLFMDILTKQGIGIFWPLSNWKIGLWVRSGGVVEEILFVLLLLGDIFIVGKLVFESLF